ncbi:MAG: rRNA pseudouridine synthase [Candidatus Eisenbacteria bacterium]|uniref:rRNA pseudouridine synthase n=1 Tax=Eiseniibacteriota bacterium TaxID=2212470 RepID=A0A7Y2E7N6_UNCEI|nr:rRNA pseudouridine synthase [Candidatus Eisenbacteria bacterium]
MRINRYLSACGVASRRGAETLIEDGRVKVNGSLLKDLATFVEPGRDRVELDGKVLNLPQEFTYLLLNKPLGVVTTASDPEGRSTVLGFVPPKPRVFPVGRLDFETSGALLMINDGGMAHRLLHPQFKVDKQYEVTVQGTLPDDLVATLANGVDLEGRKTAPAQVSIRERDGRRTKLSISIREGRNRQVRRMLESVGHEVIDLRRVRFGPIELGNLKEGTYRSLTEEEVKALHDATTFKRQQAHDRPKGTKRSSRPFHRKRKP